VSNVNDINTDASGDIQVDVKTMPSISVATGVVKVSKILSTSPVTGTVSVGNINLDASSDVQVDVKTMPTVNATGYVTVKSLCWKY